MGRKRNAQSHKVKKNHCARSNPFVLGLLARQKKIHAFQVIENMEGLEIVVFNEVFL